MPPVKTMPSIWSSVDKPEILSTSQPCLNIVQTKIESVQSPIVLDEALTPFTRPKTSRFKEQVFKQKPI